MDCRTVHGGQEGAPGGMETEKEEGGDPPRTPELPGKEDLYAHHRQDDFLYAV